MTDMMVMSLRMPRDLNDKIKASSEAHNRSVTAEINERLQASFGAKGSTEALRSFLRAVVAGEIVLEGAATLAVLDHLVEEL